MGGGGNTVLMGGEIVSPASVHRPAIPHRYRFTQNSLASFAGKQKSAFVRLLSKKLLFLSLPLEFLFFALI
jgi:hypothetical protein